MYFKTKQEAQEYINKYFSKRKDSIYIKKVKNQNIYGTYWKHGTKDIGRTYE